MVRLSNQHPASTFGERTMQASEDTHRMVFVLLGQIVEKAIRIVIANVWNGAENRLVLNLRVLTRRRRSV
jgi:hypothetical protein